MRRRHHGVHLLAAVMLAGSCGGETVGTDALEAADSAADSAVGVSADSAVGVSADADAVIVPERPLPEGWVAVVEEPQRSGDPERGYEVILEGAYVGCGVPAKAYYAAEGFGLGASGEPAPGSVTGLPWYLSRFDTVGDVDVIGPNCLTCHAGLINGELMVGLGSTNLNFVDAAGGLGELDAETIQLVSQVAALDAAEVAELTRFAERFKTVSPYVGVDTAGVNPADNLAAILFAHRDPETLAWSSEPLIEPPPPVVVPIDVPPWWRMAKKHAMFYIAAGRGDHARIMMTASTICVDSVEEAQSIDATMGDVRAFITSLEPPPWPWAVDAALAEQGEAVFAATCATCHGTYGDVHTYPNLVIPAGEVGTDPTLAQGASQFGERFLDWFHASFYGQTARLEPQDGYVPPPLDGIWATAPFLHNGSVPTLAALLDSATRPTYWQRTFDSSDYDQSALGWHHVVLEHGQDEEPVAYKRELIYDTSRLGYANTGHLYGDGLTPDDRLALLEYLKTL